jgi:hypothetical protein
VIPVELPAIDQYIQTNNGSVFQTIINNEGIDEATKQNVRRLAVSSPEMLAKVDAMLKESGDVSRPESVPSRSRHRSGPS